MAVDPFKTRKPKNDDPDARMTAVVVQLAQGTWMPDKDLRALKPKNLPFYIAELRKAETASRQMRKRLEALQAGLDRPCPECGRPVAGRPDKRFCSTECRVRAHRATSVSKLNEASD